jgi:hypothetical protein
MEFTAFSSQPVFSFFLKKVFLKSSKMDKNNCPIFNFSKKNSNKKNYKIE